MSLGILLVHQPTSQLEYSTRADQTNRALKIRSNEFEMYYYHWHVLNTIEQFAHCTVNICMGCSEYEMIV